MGLGCLGLRREGKRETGLAKPSAANPVARSIQTTAHVGDEPLGYEFD